MLGTLFFNGDRPDILFEDGTTYGGLHCGNCLQYFQNGNWSDVRLEYDACWYLICNQQAQGIQYGTQVKI